MGDEWAMPRAVEWGAVWGAVWVNGWDGPRALVTAIASVEATAATTVCAWEEAMVERWGVARAHALGKASAQL